LVRQRQVAQELPLCRQGLDLLGFLDLPVFQDFHFDRLSQAKNQGQRFQRPLRFRLPLRQGNKL
jgi:hypothetical protein